ncbi:helix-turn-helix transcriptional regulator [Pelagicoccus albus]|uniref:Helix-turn-helix transcriptional regulator n=1 Tax=Pelagicoccus albus TaxID=415222 RepID=A0A7X1E971_9BACT|nr:helix-turn-helix transcriptional regulator [Pelagicoccus albus]MBC2607520.1 helix-turn-helix transcriptional regulator [Pelagicoccus albus]
MADDASEKLEKLISRLGIPSDPLLSDRKGELILPENIICFQHDSAAKLNQPADGRALHHRFVLILALSGGATVCVEDKAVRLKEGRGMLVFPFQFHHYTDPQGEDLKWLFVTFEAKDATELEHLRYRSFKLDESLLTLGEDLVETYLGKDNNDLLVMRLGLMLGVIRRLSGRSLSKLPESTVEGIVPSVNLAALNSKDQPTVEEIAASLGISVSHLRASFRASCGISLGRHLRRLRVEEACRLLRVTKKSVAEIADECNFNSIDSFSRCFRSVLGVTPLAYRKSSEK